MRLDQYLKLSRIVKRRALTKELCQKGLIRINGKEAKASKEVKEGDVIEIDTVSRHLKVKVLKVPAGKNVSKKAARELYETLEDKRKEIRDVIDLI